VQALLAATGGQVSEPRSPARWASGRGCWGMLGDGRTAVIEMAAASGLALVPPGRRDPTHHTYGTGELIRVALDAGASRCWWASAAARPRRAGRGRPGGGRGLFQSGRRAARAAAGGRGPADLFQIRMDGRDPRLAPTQIEAACDVDNPLLARAARRRHLQPAKRRHARAGGVARTCAGPPGGFIERDLGRDIRDLAGRCGRGAGRGAGGVLRARLRPGIEMVMDATRAGGANPRGDLVITAGPDRRAIDDGQGDFGGGAGRAEPPACLSSRWWERWARGRSHRSRCSRRITASRRGYAIGEALARTGELLEVTAARVMASVSGADARATGVINSFWPEPQRA